MSIRRHVVIILIFLVVSTCLPIVRAGILYIHPYLARSTYFLFIPGLVSLLFGLGLFISILSVIKKLRKDIKARYENTSLEQTYKNIIEVSGVCSIVINTSGVITFISKNAERLYGYTPPELIGTELIKCIPTEFRGGISQNLLKIERGEEDNETMQLQILTKGGIRKWASCKAYLVKDSSGKILTAKRKCN
jgi:PAS domain S-box-containing protein